MTLKIIENRANLTAEEKTYIDNTLLCGDFPWYYSPQMVKNEDNNIFFFHYLYKRNDKNPEIESKPNSPDAPLYRQIFERFCLDNEIKVNIIHRGCLNLSVYNGYKESAIHLDHPDFDHNNFILYLSDSKDYGTKIYDHDKQKVLYTSNGNKYNAIVFNGYYHSGLIPTILNHTRLVCVFTFN